MIFSNPASCGEVSHIHGLTSQMEISANISEAAAH